MERIELSQYRLDLPDEEIKLLEDMGIKLPPDPLARRRCWVPFRDIWYPAAIPGETRRCLVVFKDKSQMVVAENYDDFCTRLMDFENRMRVED